jgi:hypothetical protein
MARLQIERVALCALCAGCGWYQEASSTERGAPQLTVDKGSATTSDDVADTTPDLERVAGDELDATPVCQSRLFAFDPLATEATSPSCTHDLAFPVVNRANILVKIAGQVRAPGDSQDGWLVLDDGMTVLLLGQACDDVLAGADLELSALCEEQANASSKQSAPIARLACRSV